MRGVSAPVAAFDSPPERSPSMATVRVCSGGADGDGGAGAAEGAAEGTTDGGGLGALAHAPTTKASSATIHPRRTRVTGSPGQLQSGVARNTRPTADVSSLTSTIVPDWPSGVFTTRNRAIEPRAYPVAGKSGSAAYPIGRMVSVRR